jgi:hypothetical protein
MIDRDRVPSIKLDTVKVRSNMRLIISTSPIDHHRIIGSIEDLIDPSLLLWSIEHPTDLGALVWLIVIEFDQSNLTKWMFIRRYDRSQCISPIDNNRINRRYDRSNMQLILSTSLIDHDRIIGLIEDLIDLSVSLRSIEPIALVWLNMIEFNRSNLT